jgi:hypothetical protein
MAHIDVVLRVGVRDVVPGAADVVAGVAVVVVIDHVAFIIEW